MKHEYTHTRKEGTKVISPKTPGERIEAIRQIVTEKQYAKIDGCMIDLFSASAILQVFDSLNHLNQVKFALFPAPKMAEIAFKLLK